MTEDYELIKACDIQKGDEIRIGDAWHTCRGVIHQSLEIVTVIFDVVLATGMDSFMTVPIDLLIPKRVYNEANPITVDCVAGFSVVRGMRTDAIVSGSPNTRNHPSGG